MRCNPRHFGRATGWEQIVVFHGGNSTNPMSLAWYAGLAEEYRLIVPDIMVNRDTAEWTFDKPVHPYPEQPTGTGTLWISQDSVIVAWEYQNTGPAEVMVDGERRKGNVTQRNVQTYTAVGETTVERPEWVDTARERDPAPSEETADT